MYVLFQVSLKNWANKIFLIKSVIKTMKKTLTILLACLIALAAGFIVAKSYPDIKNYYESRTEKGVSISENLDNLDSLWVMSLIDEYMNPTFTQSYEAVQFRRSCMNYYSIDSIFKAMPENMLLNVAEVLINRDGIANKRTIVYEYRRNKEVYDNLSSPDHPAQQLTPDTAPDNDNAAPSNGDTSHSPRDKPNGSVSYTRSDTTVNGTTYKKVERKEVYYE